MLPFTWKRVNRAIVKSTISTVFETTILLPKKWAQTSVTTFRYYAQLQRFLSCSDTNDTPKTSPPNKHPTDQYSICQLSIETRDALAVERSCHHGSHIPSQQVDRYRDNNSSKSKACWIFFNIMPHFIKPHDDCASRFGVKMLRAKFT